MPKPRINYFMQTFRTLLLGDTVLHTWSHLNPGTMLTGLRAASSQGSSTNTSLWHLWFIISDIKQRSGATCASWNFIWKQNLFFPKGPTRTCPTLYSCGAPENREQIQSYVVQMQAEHNQSFSHWFQEYFGILQPLIWPSQWSNRSFALAKDRKTELSSH